MQCVFDICDGYCPQGLLSYLIYSNRLCGLGDRDLKKITVASFSQISGNPTLFNESTSVVLLGAVL